MRIYRSFAAKTGSRSIKRLLELFVCFVLRADFIYLSLAAPHSMQDLNSLTRDQTHAPDSGSQTPNHWTTREFPIDYC